MSVRVLISGDRNWRCGALARRIVARLVERYGPDLTLIHGGADGVDSAFGDAGCDAGLVVIVFRAEWARLAEHAAKVAARKAGEGVPAEEGDSP